MKAASRWISALAAVLLGAASLATAAVAERLQGSTGEALSPATDSRGGGASPGPSHRAEAPGAGKTVRVYFSNGQLQREPASCDETFPRRRAVAVGPPRPLLLGALRALVRGPSRGELDRGYSSWFSTDTVGVVRGVRIVGSSVRVDFFDLRRLIPDANSSCGSAQLLGSLDATVRALIPQARPVYSIGGSCRAFADWLQRVPPTSCPPVRPAVREPRLIRIDRSIGGAALGMGEQELRERYGPPRRVRPAGGEGWRGRTLEYRRAGGGLRALIVGGRVVVIDTTSARYRAPGGAGVGARLELAGALPGFTFDPCTGGYSNAAAAQPRATLFGAGEKGRIDQVWVYRRGFLTC